MNNSKERGGMWKQTGEEEKEQFEAARLAQGMGGMMTQCNTSYILLLICIIMVGREGIM